MAEEMCDCGHLIVAHEVSVRAGRGWFALGALGAEEDRQAEAEGRVWLRCGHCEDGCSPARLDGPVNGGDDA